MVIDIHGSSYIGVTQHLRVFDPKGVYLATKKIGKNNPKAAESEADNAARQEWNRTADMALLSGIAEETIIELKNEEIHNKAADSVTKHGWLPELCQQTDDDEQGGLRFEIDKSRISIRLTAPYSEGRRAKASQYAKQQNIANKQNKQPANQ